mmetsp:Transcript_25977/g.34499  ORF Transcript_25977/g.34499 Transcript_25977/m.34499 type:complete len:81 (-) Transcript_25977:1276-1518(-)
MVEEGTERMRMKCVFLSVASFKAPSEISGTDFIDVRKTRCIKSDATACFKLKFPVIHLMFVLKGMPSSQVLFFLVVMMIS